MGGVLVGRLGRCFRPTGVAEGWRPSRLARPTREVLCHPGRSRSLGRVVNRACGVFSESCSERGARSPVVLGAALCYHLTETGGIL
eukprot:scaffold22642_cov57-Phaeocystis_antarctica.AAC.2